MDLLEIWEQPRARPYLIVIFAALVLGGFIFLRSVISLVVDAYHERAPKMGSECLQSHQEQYIGYTTDFETGRTIPVTRYKTVCDLSVPRCIAGGKNYTGNLYCEGDRLTERP